MKRTRSFSSRCNSASGSPSPSTPRTVIRARGRKKEEKEKEEEEEKKKKKKEEEEKKEIKDAKKVVASRGCRGKAEKEVEDKAKKVYPVWVKKKVEGEKWKVPKTEEEVEREMEVFLKALEKEKEKKKLYERVFDLAKEVAPNAKVIHLSLHLLPPPSTSFYLLHPSPFPPPIHLLPHFLNLIPPPPPPLPLLTSSSSSHFPYLYS